MRIVVAGGTGLVGRHLVSALTDQHEVVILSRSKGVDLTTGRGLAEALSGADAVVDVTNIATQRRRASVDFFTTSSRQLVDAGRREGVRHHVALSIVGVDRVDSGYYAGKRAQESVVLDGRVPGSVLRATQFHEFVPLLVDATRGPIAPLPQMLIQPVAAREVADALASLVVGPAVGMAPEVAGPEPHLLGDLARRLVAARRQRRRVLAVTLPASSARAAAGGALLPTAPGPRGVQTFDQWLEQSFAPAGTGGR